VERTCFKHVKRKHDARLPIHKWCSRAVLQEQLSEKGSQLVVEEIEWLQANFKFDMIWFVDDVFKINHRWVKEFAEALGRKTYGFI
jgi:hypothetical protein